MTPDIASLLSALAALNADATSLVSPLSDAQVNFQPANGTRWSIGQNLDHLVKANAAYLDVMTTALEHARAARRMRRVALAPGLPGRWFLSALEPPPRMRVRAPSTILPASSFSTAAVLAEFRASLERAARLLEASADLDLNGTRVRNPFIPLAQVRTSTGFLILAAHGRRHLWQARQVLDAQGFPR